MLQQSLRLATPESPVALTLGHPKAFEAAVGSTDADDTALENLARSLGEVGHPLTLVIDMVQGRTGPVMAAQLASLVRHRALGPLRIVLLAQEQVLTALSAAELAAAGVTHLDLRGLTFEEFVTLAGHHGHSDRLSLHAVYETLTSGRITGLPPQFASTLARLVSVAQMLDIVRLPAEDRLAEADRRRFDGVSAAARGAAERLVCFAVPFSRSDAEEAFGEERVGAALADLTSLGLMARRSDMFEMHELVRAGIEASLAPSVRLDAHRRLAEWAETRVLVGARIHHLVRSSQQTAANDAARTAFLRGEAWDIVASYVAEHRLVTAKETVDTYLANQARDAGHWQLPDVLRSLGDPSAAGVLFDRVQRAGLSLLADYGRGFPVLAAILALSPERLKPLMELCLLSPGDARMRAEAVGLLTLARSRKERRLDDDALAFILDLPERQRALFAPLLWVDGRRDSLRAALRLGPHRTDDTRRLEDPSTRLRLDSEADVVEFLAALPFVEPGLLFARRSVGLHEQSSILEAQRDPLSLHAPALCTSAAVEPLVRAQALRVLVFLAYPVANTLWRRRPLPGGHLRQGGEGEG